MLIRFDLIHERNGRTDKRTDGQTLHDSKDRACIASRGKNRAVGMLKLTTDKHEASCGLFATAELLVSADGGPILIIFRRLVQNDMSTW